ncbi:hypothetical protein FOXB_03884 [Fusarium oxysporum f. sp. conglutinans Fo5176]|uniref:C2H2-type domain-containing protein n=2 Tax=Fusarium oxysporum TaxID=5507 RepID=F9FBV6_FUSOF|nr:hypothetical protein FOXB_03884 [Fusarium oxysporum f. sp. conglutinans Fo5176]
MDSYDDFQSTPTGKVSKAKKGKPVHVCSECQKVYTRAEHLRRHQSSHQEPQFECPVCQRRFHRKDLLERHYKRIQVRQEYHQNIFWHTLSWTSTMRYIYHTEGRPLDLLRGTSTNISVGSTIEDRAANMWSLPIALISRHSLYMEAMSPGSGIFPKAHINLPDDDPAVFGLFVEWLYNGTYTDFISPSSSNIHARCWGLSDELLCNEFKNYVMGRLYKQHMEFSMACEDMECHLKYLKEYMDFDEVNFIAITPSATEPTRLSVRQKRRNKKKTTMASTKSEENAESRSVGALSLKQESPGGNESEPVQASVSGDDNKPYPEISILYPRISPTALPVWMNQEGHRSNSAPSSILETNIW